MMPVVRVSDAVFERLKQHAEPFVDNPDSVIRRLLDFYDTTPRKKPRRTRVELTLIAMQDPENPPDLTHSRLTQGAVGGVKAKTWNGLVDAAHRVAMRRLKTFEALKSISRSHIAKGERTDSGFHYLPDIGVSIQGIDSDLAWRNAFHLAKHLELPIHAEFQWRDKSGAAHPGKRGLLKWPQPHKQR